MARFHDWRHSLDLRRFYSPVQTRFLQRPFLKSWNTRFRCSCGAAEQTVGTGSQAAAGGGDNDRGGGAFREADLSHLGVDVEAGVSQLGDLLGEELHSLGGVAEDYGLVDLELRTKAEISDHL